jgi:hypothetical protein
MTILRKGESGDFLYIDSLRKVEGSALGFIPKDFYLSILENRRIASRDRHQYCGIYITDDEGQQTGYCCYSLSGPIVDIFQIVVQEDARRWYRALMLINQVEIDAKRLQKQGIKARVAHDLESNYFWKACGYEIVKQVTSTWLNQRESKSKRPLNIYFKPLTSLFETERTHSSVALEGGYGVM